MKKLFILSAIALSGLFYTTADAQLRIHFGINFLPHVYVRPAIAVDVPPPAPVVYDDESDQADYNSADDYYYLPDVNAYYDVADQCYYYNDGDNWVSAAYLPGDYANFDWRSARHFEVRALRPYLHNDFYMNRYHGAGFNWARYNAPRGGYDNHFDADRAQRFDNRGYDQQFANHDRGGFDNRGSYGQNFDNGNRYNFPNRDNHAQQFGQMQNNQNRGQQFGQMQNNQNQNRDRGNFGQPSNQNFGNRGQQQDRMAQNNRAGYAGHAIANRRMF